MKVWTHRYELVSTQAGRRTRNGVLLKVDWASNEVGYSDLHPWPEFGEPALEHHLLSLGGSELTPLVELSLEYNWLDREFRKRHRNAFLGLALPRSHKLVGDLKFINQNDLSMWQKAGFTHLKIKLGDRIDDETAALTRVVNTSDFQLRLDLNAKLSCAEFTAWWSQLDDGLKAKIDFIEDPTGDRPLTFAGPWANDWKVQELATVTVLKPVRESVAQIEKAKSRQRVVFTHGLDHPLGQAAALWAAADFYRRHPEKAEVGGFAAADIYEPNEFSAVWHCPGPLMKPPSGTGFGFNKILESLTWERIL